MMGAQYSAAVIEAIIDTLPVALLLVDHDHQVTEAFISNRRLRHFREQNLVKLLAKFLSSETVEKIVHQLEQTIVTNQAGCIRKVSFQSLQGLEEYASCRITPLPRQDCIAIVFSNESETVLMEQELQALAEQAEAVQRELCVAMSTMDFHLMDLDQSHKRLQVLYKVASIVQRDVHEQDVLEEIVDIVKSEFNDMYAAIFLLNESGDRLIAHAQRGCFHTPSISIDSGIIGFAARQRELVYVPDVSKDPRNIQGTTNCVSELAIPLIVSDRIIGVLDLACPAGHSLSPYDIELLRTVAAQAAVTISHVQHVALIKKVAITDELTGLYNFHYFSTLLEQEYRRARRYNHSLALLMIDIDFFKHINDTYGHLVGNDVLAQVANLIRLACRDVDWVCRYGGEEFTVLLPETTLQEAQAVAERIRTMITDYSFEQTLRTCPRLSVSIGVAANDTNVSSEKQLVAHADCALYSAKQASRNCVRVFTS